MHVIQLDSSRSPHPPSSPPPPLSAAGLLEKGDKRITPFAKQNPHYLCRRGSVRYARLCPPDSVRRGRRNVDTQIHVHRLLQGLCTGLTSSENHHDRERYFAEHPGGSRVCVENKARYLVNSIHREQQVPGEITLSVENEFGDWRELQHSVCPGAKTRQGKLAIVKHPQLTAFCAIGLMATTAKWSGANQSSPVCLNNTTILRFAA
ncbi:hypothetical protein KM043_018337 [Ampulex compressa]|nr:hypothetical protein KM043_018337 [Ampulex compressa]